MVGIKSIRSSIIYVLRSLDFYRMDVIRFINQFYPNLACKSPHARPQQVCAANEFSELLDTQRCHDLTCFLPVPQPSKDVANQQQPATRAETGKQKSSATMKRKLIRCSGWPVNFFRSSGSCFRAAHQPRGDRDAKTALLFLFKYCLNDLNVFKAVPISSVLFRCACSISLADNRINKHIQTHTKNHQISLVLDTAQKQTVAGKAGSNSQPRSWVATPTGHVFKWHFPGQGGKEVKMAKNFKELQRTSKNFKELQRTSKNFKELQRTSKKLQRNFKELQRTSKNFNSVPQLHSCQSRFHSKLLIMMHPKVISGAVVIAISSLGLLHHQRQGDRRYEDLL